MHTYKRLILATLFIFLLAGCSLLEKEPVVPGLIVDDLLDYVQIPCGYSAGEEKNTGLYYCTADFGEDETNSHVDIQIETDGEDGVTQFTATFTPLEGDEASYELCKEFAKYLAKVEYENSQAYIPDWIMSNIPDYEDQEEDTYFMGTNGTAGVEWGYWGAQSEFSIMFAAKEE